MSSKKTLTQTRYPVLRPADKVGMGKGRRGSKRRNEVEPRANFAADRALEYIYFFSKVTSILRSAVYLNTMRKYNAKRRGQITVG